MSTVLIKRKSNQISEPPAKMMLRCCCSNCFYREEVEESVGSNQVTNDKKPLKLSDDDDDDDVQEVESQLLVVTYDQLIPESKHQDIQKDREIKPPLYSFQNSPMTIQVMEETGENEVEIIKRADFYRQDEGGWFDFNGCPIIDNHGFLLGRFSQIDEELYTFTIN